MGIAFETQIGVGIATAFACFFLTRSTLAAALIAACPFLIVYELSILSETLLIFLLFTGWLLLNRGRPIISGFLVGLAILTNDVFLALPLFALPFGWKLGRFKPFAIMAGVAYLTVSIWAGHNLATVGRFIVSDGRMGYNLWVGTWERNGDWLLKGVQSPPDFAFRSPQEKAELMSAIRRKASATRR